MKEYGCPAVSVIVCESVTGPRTGSPGKPNRAAFAALEKLPICNANEPLLTNGAVNPVAGTTKSKFGSTLPSVQPVVSPVSKPQLVTRFAGPVLQIPLANARA